MGDIALIIGNMKMCRLDFGSLLIIFISKDGLYCFCSAHLIFCKCKINLTV